MEIIRNLPIFHGTDARVFFMDDDVRIQFKRDIVGLIDYDFRPGKPTNSIMG